MKIGKTDRDPLTRADEIGRTLAGKVRDFRVVWSQPVPDCRFVEATAHRMLARRRARRRGELEWFVTDVASAQTVVINATTALRMEPRRRRSILLLRIGATALLILGVVLALLPILTLLTGNNIPALLATFRTALPF